MQFHQLKRAHANRRSVQVGRGGKRGKTSGRGGKGQTARAGHKVYPQIRDMIKRIPKLRGRGKQSFKSYAKKSVPVNIEVLESKFEAGAAVNPKTLTALGVISTTSGNVPKVKILGRGTLLKKLVVSGVAVSQSAKAAIEKAGGSIDQQPTTHHQPRKSS